MRLLLGGPRHTMRQLNNALDDALAGFDDSAKTEDDVDEGLVIDENPRKNVKSSSPIKLKLNVPGESKPKRKLVSSSRATMEDMRMTKAHQVWRERNILFRPSIGYGRLSKTFNISKHIVNFKHFWTYVRIVDD